MTFLALQTSPTLNPISTAELQEHIRASHSVIFQTQASIIETFVSSVDNFHKAHFIASKLPFVSAFTTIFNCFKLHDFILDIIISILDACLDFLLAIITSYSRAFLRALSISETI